MFSPRGLSLSVVLALVAGLISTAPISATAQTETPRAPFLVGTGTASADPSRPVCLGGYGSFCNRPMKGIKDPLETAAFAITGKSGAGDTVIIVKTTAVGLFASYKPEQGETGIYQVRQRIAEATGVPADHVIVTSDHSHAGPDTIGIWGGVDRAYMQLLANSIVKAATRAYESRQPASLSVAAVAGPQLDSSYDLGPTNDEAMDDEFRVLFADAPDGNAIATIVNYAPHATVCGDCGDEASGDWTAWAAQEVAARDLGLGIGFVGVLGATDWRKSGNQNAREAEARGRINTLLDAAIAQRQPVVGDEVKADIVFIREELGQPILAANLLPGGVLNKRDGEGDVRIDRDTRPPWLTGPVLSTYVGALRIGDVFISTFPGEPFPQLQDALRDGGVTGPSTHFLLGAANDFLGYMVANDAEYQQALREGAAFLAGCPEENITHNTPGYPADEACPDHWTLMVSPTIGQHAVCTIQDAAARIGFTAGTRNERCAALTALDGQAAPPEHPGASEPAPEAGAARAGVASIDASWHIGASAGQFSSDEPPMSDEAVDPHGHSTKKRPSKGLGSRIDVRALVVEEQGGEKVAIVSHDLYLPQDLLTRRIANLVAEQTDIPAENVMVTASHNHNSAHYSTPGWGTWIFQDVFDLRFFEYMAERGAAAVVKANGGLVPVRMGGATSTFNEITSHTYGPQIADDGTPAGQPYDHTTGELTVVAFDDMSNPSAPKPLATWVVFGVHPEWTWGYDLLNGDISAATTRIVDREVGGITVWSGREIGTSGPHKDRRAHEPEERREYQDNGFAQIDRAARLLADAVSDTRTDVATGTPEDPDRYAPYSQAFEVKSVSQRFAPPMTRPYPGVSNCNSEALFHGDPRVPILGLPNCSSPRDPPSETGPFGDPIRQVASAVGDAYGPMGGTIYEELKKAGVPIPESYSATKLTAVEETAAVHLMAIKLGEVGITVCPCELFTDTALNIESRIDKESNNLWIGWNWADQQTPAGRDWCVQNADSTWTCANPQQPARDLDPVSDIAYRRMIAQIENDASGWETDVKTLGSEAEPYEPSEIRGNFTHEEFPRTGFGLPIAVGMGNDYWGYVPEYRDYRAFDHYRKALSGLGPHGADFLATRLARMAVSLNGGPGPEIRPIDIAYQAESARAEVVATGLGELADAYELGYRSTLPTDGGGEGIVSQPDSVKLFSAAHIEWIGGSTYADMPSVTVQRKVGDDWVDYADTNGEIELTVKMPRPEELPEWRAGEFEWKWTAAWEAFGSDIPLPDASGERRRATPIGTYQVVIEGQRRTGPGDVIEDYEITSDPIEVLPWDGITVDDVALDGSEVSFTVGSSAAACPGKKGQSELHPPGEIDLPDSYDSPFEFIECEWRVFKYGLGEDRWQSYCSFCSFRPWADTSDVASATVTILRPDGSTQQVPAERRGERWVAPVQMYEGDRAYVARGGVVDEYGNINGTDSDSADGSGPRPTPTETTEATPSPTAEPTTGPTDLPTSAPTDLPTSDPSYGPTPSTEPTPDATESSPPGGGGGGGGGGNGGEHASSSPSPASSSSNVAAGQATKGLATTTIGADRVVARHGADFELFGSLTRDRDCLGPMEIEIRQRVHGTDVYEPIAITPVADDGSWAFSITGRRNASYVGEPVDTETCEGSMSTPVDVLVRAKITMRRIPQCRPDARIMGRVVPAQDGTRVTLQRREAGAWIGVDRDVLDERSRFFLHAERCGRYRVRWLKQTAANETATTRFRL